MSRGLKITLVVLAIILFLCCVGGLGATLLGTRLIGRAFITNPERVQAVSRQIAEYEVPSGYEEILAINVAGIKMVAIGPSSSTADMSVIMLMQFPTGMEASREEMERQLERTLAQQTGLGSADMTVIGQQQAVIRGESVSLTVREGTTSEGIRLRQVSGLFQGRGGPAMMMITGEVDSWDQAMIDRFIASIR